MTPAPAVGQSRSATCQARLRRSWLSSAPTSPVRQSMRRRPAPRSLPVRPSGRRRRRARAPSTSSDVPLISSSIWMRASPIACRRCLGSFFRHRASSGRTSDAAAGSALPVRLLAHDRHDRVGDVVALKRRAVPSASRRARTPNAQMSARRVDGLPRACSGAMYAAVPRITPAARAPCIDSVGEFAASRRCDAPVRVERLRETEIQHLDRAVGADLDVGRLQIAMDDALLVRGFERLGDLLRDRQRLVERNRALRDAIRERRRLRPAP